MIIMKKQLLIMFFVSLLTSCATLPTDPAPWDASPAAIRQVFPEIEYIAQRGRGKTRAAAEANGAAQLAQFFNSQITSQMRITERESIQNDRTRGSLETQSNTLIEQETFVQTQMNLFGIRFAQDAYYNRAQKEWITVAYINRNEAWQVYSPRFRQQADSFISLFDAAENERDQFRRALRFLAADDYSKSDDFQNASLLGQILHPARINAEFESVRARIASIPQRLESSKRNASIFIDCPGDFESLVSNVFSSRFAALGFPVANNRNTASAVCRITISEGRQQRDLGIFYHPSLQAVVSSNTLQNTETLFSFSAEGERAQAVTPDVAKRRAFQSLADKVRESFSLNINEVVR